MVNTTYQVGSAIGLAVMVAVAGSKSASLAREGAERAVAIDGGFSASFLGAAVIAFGAAALAAFAIRAPRPTSQLGSEQGSGSAEAPTHRHAA